MALAKKCDRCGKFYEHYTAVNQTGAYNAVGKIRRLLNGAIGSCDTAIDLCPDCMAAFEKFIKDEER